MDDELKQYFEGIFEKLNEKQCSSSKIPRKNMSSFRLKLNGKAKLNKTVFKVMVLNKFKSVKDDKVKRRMTYVENKKQNIENFREKIRQISAPKSDNLGVKKPDFLSPRRTHNLNKFLKINDIKNEFEEKK